MPGNGTVLSQVQTRQCLLSSHGEVHDIADDRTVANPGIIRPKWGKKFRDNVPMARGDRIAIEGTATIAKQELPLRTAPFGQTHPVYFGPRFWRRRVDPGWYHCQRGHPIGRSSESEKTLSPPSGFSRPDVPRVWLHEYLVAPLHHLG